MQKKFNFQSSKQKYYKNIKNLLDKINSKFDDRNSENVQGFPEDNIEHLKIINDKLELNAKESVNCDKKNFCKICNKNLYKYTCPKCKIVYCSVGCYKSHNIDCTEDFYKRNVIEELKSTKEDQGDSKKFRTKLKEMYERLEANENKEKSNLNKEENLLTEERQIHLIKILEKLEDGSFDFSSDLTPSDWKEFEKFLNGYVETYRDNLHLWKPFWLSKLENDCHPSLEVYDDNFKKEYDLETLKKIKEYEINEFLEYYNPNDKNSKENTSIEEEMELEDILDYDENDFKGDDDNFYNLSENSKKFIEIKYDSGKTVKTKIDRNLICHSILLKFFEIPSLRNLSTLNPSDSNIFTLVYILSNLLFLFKLYNGEMNENLDEIIEFLTRNCKVLYDINKNFNDYDLISTLNEFISNVSDGKNYRWIHKMVLDDLLSVFQNKFYLFEALIRMYEILHRYSRSNTNYPQKITSIINKSKHKIIYFLSYLKCLGREKLDEVVEKIEEITASLKIQERLEKNFNKSH